MRTGLDKSKVRMALQEANMAIPYMNSQGTAVKLPGVDALTPSVNREGAFKINIRADTSLRKRITAPHAYSDRMDNKGRIGLDNACYNEFWNTNHPDDPLNVQPPLGVAWSDLPYSKHRFSRKAGAQQGGSLPMSVVRLVASNVL